MSRCSVEKQQLFDEIDELQAIRLERDSLQKENSKLKHHLEKHDARCSESRDLKRELDDQITAKDELQQQIKTLNHSLSLAIRQKSESTDMKENLKVLQERNIIQEQQISQLIVQIHKLKSQNGELKEVYESRINDLKTAVEERDRDSFCLSEQGETMEIITEHRLLEIQETLKSMEENWIKPDVGASLRAEIRTLKESLSQFETKMQTTSHKNIELEEELCATQQEITRKAAEITDLLRNCSEASQKISNSKHANATLKTTLESVMKEKEAQKSRCQDLESELCNATELMATLKVELNVKRNEIETKNQSLDSHVRRFSETSEKVITSEQKCRTLSRELEALRDELKENKRTNEYQRENSNRELGKSKQDVSKMTEELESVKNEKGNLETGLQTLKNSLDTKCEELSKLRYDDELAISQLNEELDAEKSISNSLRIESDGLESQLSSLKHELNLSMSEASQLREQKQLLNADSDQLRSDKDDLYGKLDAIKEELAVKVDALEQEKIKLLKEVENKKDNCAMVTEELENYKSQLVIKAKELGSSSEAFNHELISLRTELDKEKKLRCVRDEQSAAIIDSIKKEKETQSSTWQSKMEEVRGKCRQVEERVRSLKKEIEAKESELLKVKGESLIKIQGLESSLEEVTSNLSKQQRINSEIKLQFDERERELDDMRTEKYSLEEYVTKLKNDLETSKNTFSGLEEESSLREEQIRMQLVDEQKLTESQEKQISCLQDEVKIKNEGIVAGNVKLEDIGLELEASQDKLSSIIQSHVQEMNALQNQLRLDSEIREEALAKLTQLQEEVALSKDAQEEELNMLNKSIAALEEKLAESEHNYFALEMKCEQMETEHQEEMKRCKITHNEELSCLSNTIESLNNKYEESLQLKSSLQDEIIKLRQSIELHKEGLDSCTKTNAVEMSDLIMRSTDLEQKDIETQQQKSLLEEEVAALQKSLTQSQERFSDLEKVHEEDSKRLNDKIAELDKSFNDSNQRKFALEEELHSLQESASLRMEERGKSTGIHQKELEKMKGTICELEEKYNDALQRTSASERECGSLKQNIVRIREELKQAKDNHEVAENKLTNTIDELTAKLKDSVEKISEFEKNTRSLEERIKQYQEDLERQTSHSTELSEEISLIAEKYSLANKMCEDMKMHCEVEKAQNETFLKEQEQVLNEKKELLESSEKRVQELLAKCDQNKIFLQSHSEKIASLETGLELEKEKSFAVMQAAQISNKLQAASLQTSTVRETELESSLSKVESLKGKLASTESVLREFEEKSVRISMEYDELKEIFDENKEKLESELKQAIHDLEVKDTLLKDETSQITRLRSTYEKEKAEFHELLEGKDRLLQNIKKEYSMRNMLQEDQIDTLTLEISAMSSQLNDVKRELENAQQLRDLREVKMGEIEEQGREDTKHIQKMKDELIEAKKYTKLLQEQKEIANEKVEAIRLQFTEKYKGKQERVLSLEKDLRDWQARADEQTLKVDKMASMYNDKRRQLSETTKSLDKIRLENAELQESVRDLKMKNEILISSNSQMSVNKATESKKIKDSSYEIRCLKTQLEFAEREIRELKMTRTPRVTHSSLSSINQLQSVQENFRNMKHSAESSIHGDTDIHAADNLFRCRSDTYLDSPSTANKKMPREDHSELDDSLDDILNTPMNLRVRQNSHKLPQALSRDSHQTRSPLNNKTRHARSHISIESSLLNETPQKQSNQYRSQSQKQLNSNNLDGSRTSQESPDVNMNSSNLTDASYATNDIFRGHQHSTLAAHPSLLGYCRRLSTDNEKDIWKEISILQSARHTPAFRLQTFQTDEEPEDYEWGSLCRLAELQRRNAATLPHLKSSYPIETQGHTPSRGDESVRIGNPDVTMRRVTQTSSQLERSLMQSQASSRRMTLGGAYERRQFENRPSSQKYRADNSDDVFQKRKSSGSSEEIPSTPPHKNRRDAQKDYNMESGGGDSFWSSGINALKDELEMKEQIDPRRQSMMFEIPNSPHKRVLRPRGSKRSVPTADKQKLMNIPKNPLLLKTPDKSARATKKIVEEKKKTPSLMDRVRKPLGRLNTKK